MKLLAAVTLPRHHQNPGNPGWLVAWVIMLALFVFGAVWAVKKVWALLFALMLAGCAGYETTFGASYQNPEGERFEGSIKVRPTGKQTVKPQRNFSK